MTFTSNERKTRDSTQALSADHDRELRHQALESLKQKRRFARDLLGYLAVNGALWLIWALSDRSTDGSIPWPAWVSIVWGFFLALDAWKAFGTWPRPITETDIEREMNRLGRS